jgi:hypothetical protein
MCTKHPSTVRQINTSALKPGDLFVSGGTGSGHVSVVKTVNRDTAGNVTSVRTVDQNLYTDSTFSKTMLENTVYPGQQLCWLRDQANDSSTSSKRSDLAQFYRTDSPGAILYGWRSTGSALSFSGASWSVSSGYELNNVGDRFVSGDFNGDGKDDAATAYQYPDGTFRFHVWLSNGTSHTYQGPEGWYQSGPFTLSRVGGRMVTGDFNNDGKDDIAMFYRNDTGAILYVWTSTGSGFSYKGAWWSVSSGYDLNNVGDRFVSGDFNGDGKDDIATAYQYADGTFRYHVWISSGTGFTYQGATGWYQSGSFTLSRVGGRMVAGDFNNDGKDDIAMFYRNDTGAILYVWTSTGSSISYKGAWWSVSSGYDLNNVGDRFVSGDFNGDGKADVATAYQYADGTFRYHVWLSSGTGLTYQGPEGWYQSGQYTLSRVGGRMVAGNWSGD